MICEQLMHDMDLDTSQEDNEERPTNNREINEIHEFFGANETDGSSPNGQLLGGVDNHYMQMKSDGSSPDESQSLSRATPAFEGQVNSRKKEKKHRKKPRKVRFELEDSPTTKGKTASPNTK